MGAKRKQLARGILIKSHLTSEHIISYYDRTLSNLQVVSFAFYIDFRKV